MSILLRRRSLLASRAAGDPPADVTVLGTSTYTDITGVSGELPFPTGVQVGDRLLAVVTARTGTPFTCEGFSVVVTDYNATDARAAMFERVADGDEGATATITAGTRIVAFMLRLPPSSVADSGVGSYAAPVVTYPDLTASAAGSLYVACLTTRLNPNPLTWSGGLTEILNEETGGIGHSRGAVAVEEDLTAGATGTRTVSMGTDRADNGAVAAVISP